MKTVRRSVRIARLEPTDQVLTDDISRLIWGTVFPGRAETMVPGFPARLRLCVDAYRRMAERPSGAEMNAATKVLHRQVLHRRVMQAKSADLDAAAAAVEALPSTTRRELERRTPGGIPTIGELRDPQWGTEAATDLLGCCMRGVEIVPGRKRPNGRYSRPTMKLIGRFKQLRGYPGNDPEAMLVRALAEYWRSLNNGRFPRSCAHDQEKAQSPFERLVDQVLRRCGACKTCPVSLIRRVLDDIRDAEAVNE